MPETGDWEIYIKFYNKNMSIGSLTPQSIDQPKSVDERYRCGSLVYTKPALFVLFSWLLWGDFCFSLMEAIWPSILPLILRAEGTPNVVMSLVMTTIPSAMNFVLNPIISTMSDRHRGRMGRRIPFLLGATPFIALLLALIGFAPQLGPHLHGLIAQAFPGISQAVVTVSLLCLLITSFRFFELFVNTIFWYLFNDVVPVALLGRFLGLFRAIGALAGALFNIFLLQYAESHASMIFFGVALLYGTMFVLMCLNVKEGTYPPPEPMCDERGSWWDRAGTFFRECFSHRMYIFVFIYTFLISLAGGASAFSIFFPLSIGLTLADVGKVAGVAGFVSMFLMYPMGTLIDRYHPIRIMVVAQFCYSLVVALQFIFLFSNFSRDIVFVIYVVISGIAIPVSVANSSAALPLFMRIFPTDRFGQFCAANAMCGAFGMIVGGLGAGLFIDGMKNVFPGGDYYYRFVPVWNFAFMILSAFATCLVMREWKRLGGDRDYKPPMPTGPQQVSA